MNRHNIASTKPTKVVEVLSSQIIKRLTWWGQNIIPMKTHRVDILRKFDSSNSFKFWYLHYISFAIINDMFGGLYQWFNDSTWFLYFNKLFEIEFRPWLRHSLSSYQFHLPCSVAKRHPTVINYCPNFSLYAMASNEP